MMTYIARSKTIGRVDIDLLSQYKTEVDYWKSVLKRIGAVIKFWHQEDLHFVVIMKSLDLKTTEIIWDVWSY